MDIPFIGDILDFLQAAWEWIYSGIYEFVKEAFVLATKAAIYGYFQALLFALDVAYDVFQELVTEIGISDKVQQYYNMLDADLRSALAFFGIPDALMIIFSAVGTRWTLKFVPVVGR
tara:strand:+ start:220 stop:570 length:351 start_codon:yes stop_codon:yes gene_type:complete